MSASPTHSDGVNSEAFTPVSASATMPSDAEGEWPHAEAFFLSGGSTPPPPASLHPVASLVSPDRCVRQVQGPRSLLDSDSMVPSTTNLGAPVPALGGFPHTFAAQEQAARHLSETMESMDFAAQLEKLSEKDLGTLWNRLWHCTHSLRALEQAHAGPQTRWNPYRAARGGPHLREEIMNSQVAEFANVIPHDSLCLIGTTVRKPALSGPPAADRDAAARRHRATLDDLVCHNTRDPAAARAAADTAPFPTTWSLADDLAAMSVRGTCATIRAAEAAPHRPTPSAADDGEEPPKTPCRSTAVEEVFAWHGRQPEECVIAAHCSVSKVDWPTTTKNAISCGGEDGTRVTAPSAQLSLSFMRETMRQNLEQRIFDELWQHAVVPFYAAAPRRDDVPPAARTTREDSHTTPAADSPSPPKAAASPALRPPPGGGRGYTTASSAAQEPWRDGPRSPIAAASSEESAIILHLRRQSVQEDLAESAGTCVVAPPADVVAARRQIIYTGEPTADAGLVPGGQRSASPKSRPRPRTGPPARRKPSPSAVTPPHTVVAERFADITRPAKANCARTRSGSSRPRRPHSRDDLQPRREPVSNVPLPTESTAEESSLHMEDLDDSLKSGTADHHETGRGPSTLRKPTQAQGQLAVSTLAPLQRVANQALAEMGSRRRDQTGPGQLLGSRTPVAGHQTAPKQTRRDQGRAPSRSDHHPLSEADVDSRRVSRRAAPPLSLQQPTLLAAVHTQRASPKHRSPGARPTLAGAKWHAPGHVPTTAGSAARHPSPLAAPAGQVAASRVSPGSRRVRVSTAQPGAPTGLGGRLSPSSRAATAGAQLVEVSEGDGAVVDTERGVDAGGRGAATTTARGGLTRPGKPGGGSSASTRAPRTAALERPSTDHGSALFEAYRPHTRHPSAARTLGGASRGPSPLLARKQARLLEPLDRPREKYPNQPH